MLIWKNDQKKRIFVLYQPRAMERSERGKEGRFVTPRGKNLTERWLAGGGGKEFTFPKKRRGLDIRVKNAETEGEKRQRRPSFPERGEVANTNSCLRRKKQSIFFFRTRGRLVGHHSDREKRGDI